MGGAASRDQDDVKDFLWGKTSSLNRDDSSSLQTRKGGESGGGDAEIPSSEAGDEVALTDVEAEGEVGRSEDFDPNNYDPKKYGPILPNGEINWDCPCLGGAAHGPCGTEFRDAFSCFHNSKEDPKGSECFPSFKEMHNCFSKYPELYKTSDPDEDEEEEEEDEDEVQFDEEELKVINEEEETEKKESKPVKKEEESKPKVEEKKYKESKPLVKPLVPQRQPAMI